MFVGRAGRCVSRTKYNADGRTCDTALDDQAERGCIWLWGGVHCRRYKCSERTAWRVDVLDTFADSGDADRKCTCGA